MIKFSVNVTFDPSTHTWTAESPSFPCVKAEDTSLLVNALEQYGSALEEKDVFALGNSITHPSDLSTDQPLAEWFVKNMPHGIQDGETPLQAALYWMTHWRNANFEVRTLLYVLGKDIGENYIPEGLDTPALLGIVVAKLILKLHRDAEKVSAE